MITDEIGNKYKKVLREQVSKLDSLMATIYCRRESPVYLVTT